MMKAMPAKRRPRRAPNSDRLWVNLANFSPKIGRVNLYCCSAKRDAILGKISFRNSNAAVPTTIAITPSGEYFIGLFPPQREQKWGQSGLKVLVQHLYPGRSRNQGVAHGTVSTIDPHGARGAESHVGRGV